MKTMKIYVWNQHCAGACLIAHSVDEERDDMNDYIMFEGSPAEIRREIDYDLNLSPRDMNEMFRLRVAQTVLEYIEQDL